MKKTFLFAVLIVAAALFAASCGGATTTTISQAASTTATVTASTEASTTTSAVTSSSTETSGTTTSSTTGGSTATSEAGAGQVVVQLTGGDMVPPVETSNTGVMTMSLQGASVMYELDTQGLVPSDVTSAGIYIASAAAGTSTTAAGSATTAAGGGAQQGEMVVDLLTGQSGTSTTAGGTATTAAGATGSTSAEGVVMVLAKGELTEKNLTGSLQGKSLTELLTMIATIGGQGQTVWVQINTKQNPNGEIRGYIDLMGLIQQMIGGGAGTTPSSM